MPLLLWLVVAAWNLPGLGIVLWSSPPASAELSSKILSSSKGLQLEALTHATRFFMQRYKEWYALITMLHVW